MKKHYDQLTKKQHNQAKHLNELLEFYRRNRRAGHTTLTVEGLVNHKGPCYLLVGRFSVAEYVIKEFKLNKDEVIVVLPSTIKQVTDQRPPMPMVIDNSVLLDLLPPLLSIASESNKAVHELNQGMSRIADILKDQGYVPRHPGERPARYSPSFTPYFFPT